MIAKFCEADSFFLLFYSVQADLELVILLPQLLRAGITAVHHHAWLTLTLVNGSNTNLRTLMNA
jgi:hypothetical protein